MKENQEKKLQLHLWIPECKNIKEGQESWYIMGMFLKAIMAYVPPTHKGNKEAESMWDNFLDALLKKYDPEFSCGEPVHFHQKPNNGKVHN